MVIPSNLSNNDLCKLAYLSDDPMLREMGLRLEQLIDLCDDLEDRVENMYDELYEREREE